MLEQVLYAICKCDRKHTISAFVVCPVKGLNKSPNSLFYGLAYEFYIPLYLRPFLLTFSM